MGCFAVCWGEFWGVWMSDKYHLGTGAPKHMVVMVFVGLVGKLKVLAVIG